MNGASAIADFFRSLPGLQGLSERSLLLLTVYHYRQNGKTELTAPEVQEAFSAASLPASAQLASRLGKLTKGANPPLLKSEGDRFSLSLFGEREVKDYLRQFQPFSGDLEKLVGRLAGDAERTFLADAVACTGIRANRAAVVMTWLLTLDHLERYTMAHHLAAFNAALAARTDTKDLKIVVQDDFLKLRDESQLIEVLKSSNVVTKDVRKILDEALGFRNTCAHPNDIKVRDSKTASFIEDLVENVILKYPL